MHYSEKSFVPEQKHFKTKELSCFISNVTAMTTVKILFVFLLHATVSVYQISKHYLFK